MYMFSAISSFEEGATDGGTMCGDAMFFVWAIVAAVGLVALVCIVNSAVYSIRLHRAIEFRDSDKLDKYRKENRRR